MEYYYDACRQVVYVHYSSLLDTQRLANLCLKMDSDVAQQVSKKKNLKNKKTFIIISKVSCYHQIMLEHPRTLRSYLTLFERQMALNLFQKSRYFLKSAIIPITRCSFYKNVRSFTPPYCYFLSQPSIAGFTKEIY